MSDSESEIFPVSLSAPGTSSNPSRSSKNRRVRGFWTSVREKRLLEWFEENQPQSSIVFMSRGTHSKNWRPRDAEGNVITKGSYYRSAVQVVFAVEEDVEVRKMLEDDQGLQTLEIRVRNQLESWKKKYEKINNEIKRSRPSQKLEDIQIGTQLYEDLSRYHRDFPFWGRLHAQCASRPTSIRSQRNKRNRDVSVRGLNGSSDEVAETVVRSEENHFPEFAERLPRQRQHDLDNTRSGIAMGQVGRPAASQHYRNQMEGFTPEQRIRLQALENEASRMRGVQEVVMEFVRRCHPE